MIIIIFLNVHQFICQIRQLNTIQLVKLKINLNYNENRFTTLIHLVCTRLVWKRKLVKAPLVPFTTGKNLEVRD